MKPKKAILTRRIVLVQSSTAEDMGALMVANAEAVPKKRPKEATIISHEKQMISIHDIRVELEEGIILTMKRIRCTGITRIRTLHMMSRKTRSSLSGGMDLNLHMVEIHPASHIEAGT